MVENFKKQNSEVILKKSEKIDPKKLDIFISVIEIYFEQLYLLQLLHNISANQIFNANETKILFSSNLSKTIGIKRKSKLLRTSKIHKQLIIIVIISLLVIFYLFFLFGVKNNLIDKKKTFFLRFWLLLHQKSS
jgi:hypothetical protein